MFANKDQVPVLPSTSKQDNKNSKDNCSLVPVKKDNKELPELKGKPSMADHLKPLSSSLQRDFIPEEVFVALTSAANPVPYPPFLKTPRKTRSIKDFQGCIRTADGVWQHPVRRNKFQYLIQHPVCLTGAGRDVSFLYDVVAEKEGRNPPPTPEPNKASRNFQQESSGARPPLSVADSLIPEEFHIVKNRGVLGLEYYDDKYTTLLEDEENRLRVFPSMKPSGRLEVLQLMKVMDTMLEKVGADNEETGVTGLSQMHNVLEILQVEQNIYNIVFHEIIRQVSVDCAERGELLSKIRQRYIELLERIPRQMRNLYKEMMAQRVMDKHITDELFNFKEAIGQLTRELNTVREHDRKAILQAEKAYEELARAVQESELNATLLDEYRQLYEMQRARLEAQIHQLTKEKELWSTATYDLAQKVIEKNKLILAGRMYGSEKAWLKVMRHFIMLMESQDANDLSTLQQLTQEFRELLQQIGTEMEQVEEISRERARSIQNGLAGWLNYFQNHVLGKGNYTFAKGAPLLDQVLEDLKVWEKMLNEELAQYGGNMLLVRQEPLKTVADRQKQWVDLGISVLGRHKDLHGKMPPWLKMLEEINRSSNNLCEQYRIRINGENGSARILTSLVHGLEDWTFKLLALKQKSGAHAADWIKFFQNVSEWLAQIDDLLKFIGTSETPEERRRRTFKFVPVASEDLFKKIQQWILTTTSGSEQDIVQLSEELTDFHNVLSKWMVNLLIHMVPEYISHNAVPLSDMEAVRQAEKKMLNIFNLETEATGLAAKLSKFSCYIVSCCKEMVAAITRKKMATFEPDADHELKQLEKIKTECLDWIETCTLLLSGMKTTPTSLISQEELVSLFGLEVLQLQKQLPPHPEHDLQSSIVIQTEITPEEEKQDRETISMKAVQRKEMVESEEIPPLLSTSTQEQEEGTAITCPVRYIGDDSNVHAKPLKTEEVSVSGRELYASQWTTKYSKTEFQMLASLEILEERLIEAEKRAQQAEEKSEVLHEELEEALTKIHNLEGEAEPVVEASEEVEPQCEPAISSKKKPPPQPASTKTSTMRSKKSSKPKR
ncbi:hypothetical protein JRQ81_014209 [Phrynocephalus forsythii]|uniref:Axonemal dynein light chain domain-containing protein 1 n=1 Tax=Phrynocephalus forsythii TaxID=171643 RepID=A0A9Q0XWA8_9SAUR|nr:hypothetical protein JRQ81_014209 [Phrynocephalus forsythii]